ncbi:TPA: tyrosine-type recombinase/integrase [Clostridium botulinum]|nr:tyrosine-type recombinase/integrase [Clostridium botulinum]
MYYQLNDFKKHLLKNKKSEKTIEVYIRDIKHFLSYFKNKQLKDITNDDIDKYKIFIIKELEMDVKTLNKKLVAINQYLKFNGVAVDIKQEKVQSQNFLDDIFSSSDLERILRAIDKKNDLRAKAIIMTLRLTGMRVSEMLQLTKYDIDKDTITICGKGKKYRNVFISEKLRLIWRQYMTVRIDKSEMLFTGQKGAITRQTVDKIIKYYTGQAKVKKSKGHAHNLRHKFCKDLVDKDVPLDSIADIVGHENINTTRIYTRKTKKELLDIINDI